MTRHGPLDLPQIRRETLRHLDRLRLPEEAFGAYGDGGGREPDFYASMDAVHIRTVMGEDLPETLSAADRRLWARHLGGFQNPDGSFRGAFHRLSTLHNLGMAVGAFGVLGYPMPHAHDYFRDIREPSSAVDWLERIDWAEQWRASHEFWGAMHCFSMSAACPDGWRSAVFAWLDRELDPATGWWRRGVPHADRHQAPGGSAHIVPIYEHHGRPFPHPEALIDSILDLQLPSGKWLDLADVYPVSYLDLDALYLLRYASTLAPGHRSGEIAGAADRFADYAGDHWRENRDALFAEHPHHLLGFIGAVGLLQQLRPDAYPDARTWTDIFSDRRLYQTDTALPPF